MQTIGDLVDQLSVVNCKLFWNQESIMDGSYKKMNREELVQLVDKSRDLNIQRNKLIDEINAKLAKIVSGEEKTVELKKYKTGE